MATDRFTRYVVPKSRTIRRSMFGGAASEEQVETGLRERSSSSPRRERSASPPAKRAVLTEKRMETTGEGEVAVKGEENKGKGKGLLVASKIITSPVMALMKHKGLEAVLLEDLDTLSFDTIKQLYAHGKREGIKVNWIRIDATIAALDRKLFEEIKVTSFCMYRCFLPRSFRCRLGRLRIRLPQFRLQLTRCRLRRCHLLLARGRWGSRVSPRLEKLRGGVNGKLPLHPRPVVVM